MTHNLNQPSIYPVAHAAASAAQRLSANGLVFTDLAATILVERLSPAPARIFTSQSPMPELAFEANGYDQADDDGGDVTGYPEV